MMSKERTPQAKPAESSALTKPLQAVTRLAVRFPKTTIALATMLLLLRWR